MVGLGGADLGGDLDGEVVDLGGGLDDDVAGLGAELDGEEADIDGGLEGEVDDLDDEVEGWERRGTRRGGRSGRRARVWEENSGN